MMMVDLGRVLNLMVLLSSLRGWEEELGVLRGICYKDMETIAAVLVQYISRRMGCQKGTEGLGNGSSLDASSVNKT
jgi:hypothetical protein